MQKSKKDTTGTQQGRADSGRHRRSEAPLRTPPDKVKRILGRKMAGQSHRKVAREEGVSKNTVTRILNREEYQGMMAGYRSVVLEELVPDAITTLKHHLRKKSLTAGLRVLEGAQVLAKGQKKDLIEHQPKKFGLYGYGKFGDRSHEELEHAARYGTWPSKEALAHKIETGYWPEEMNGQG